jgi:uncharacterized RDD family membrane protein YckC
VSRGVAFVFDVVATAVASTIGAALIRVSFEVLGIRNTSGGRAALAYALLSSVVFAVYCVLFWTVLGRTPGMAVLGLRVVTGDGASPGLVRSVVRVLAYAISAILLLGFAWIAVDRRRQGFHDKIARTFVIYDRRDAPAADRPVALPTSTERRSVPAR